VSASYRQVTSRVELVSIDYNLPRTSIVVVGGCLVDVLCRASTSRLAHAAILLPNHIAPRLRTHTSSHTHLSHIATNQKRPLLSTSNMSDTMKSTAQESTNNKADDKVDDKVPKDAPGKT